jgi:hypothetical protein
MPILAFVASCMHVYGADAVAADLDFQRYVNDCEKFCSHRIIRHHKEKFTHIYNKKIDQAQHKQIKINSITYFHITMKYL